MCIESINSLNQEQELEALVRHLTIMTLHFALSTIVAEKEPITNFETFPRPRVPTNATSTLQYQRMKNQWEYIDSQCIVKSRVRTLTPPCVRERGRQHLFQALSKTRLVCFGSERKERSIT